MYLYSGTKDWYLRIGDTATGPWTVIANGSLPDPRLTKWNVPITVITPSGYDIPAGQVSNTSSVTEITRKKNCGLKLHQ